MNPVLVKCITPCLAALLALFAHTSLAERSDRDKPVNLESDTVEVNDLTKVSVYQGNVRLTQGTLLITGSKLVVTQDDAGFSKSTAFGNPTYFKQKLDGKDELTEGWAQRLEYDAKRDHQNADYFHLNLVVSDHDVENIYDTLCLKIQNLV